MKRSRLSEEQIIAVLKEQEAEIRAIVLTSKIHALVDADGRPVALRLPDGQVHDGQEAEALLEAMPGGATLPGDKEYDSNAIREAAAGDCQDFRVWAGG
jgi:hypothetical protein